MRMLKQVLKDLLTEQEIKYLYSSFDIIGDIAIIKIPEILYEKRYIIGEAILSNVKSVRCVFMQKSAVQGDYRIRELEHIAGEGRTLTLYKEHGCLFKIDIAKVYFSPRLSAERARIASLVSDGEVIVNMFSGISTFSIIIAKKKNNCKVYSIDLNPYAYELCKENAKINHVEESVIPILGDAKDVILSKLACSADRVLMPLPEKAKEYLQYAVIALKYDKECYIHYFTHVTGDKKSVHEKCMLEVSDILKDHKLDYRIANTRVVREVSPRTYQVVADIAIVRRYQ